MSTAHSWVESYEVEGGMRRREKMNAFAVAVAACDLQSC
jgi:hypothetical protein